MNLNFVLKNMLGTNHQSLNTEIILPSRYCKDCQMKEISTIRKPTTIKQLHPSQVSCSEILFGRAIGRVKVPYSKRQHGFEDNKEIAPTCIPDQPRIKLVRLMFYLPTICKESDASFSIEVCKCIVYV